MNKAMMKDIFKANDIPQVTSIVFDTPLSLSPKHNVLADKALEQLTFPLFVKPVSLGSSIGVSKVNNEEELQQALEVAFHYDNAVICEEAVQNLVELNCSMMVHKGTIIHSFIEKIAPTSNFLSFEEKYLNQGGTMQGIEEKVQIPAKLSPHIEKQIYELCEKVVKVLHIDGGAPRIDFLRDEKHDTLYVNEINTIPGSLQVHLRDASGINMTEFFTLLIEHAFWRRDQEKLKSIEFNSSIVDLTVNFKK
ncbi:MAG: hypothetical protein LBG59_09630 [Candidatus Peribacteria bacterium]|jgi:D-alanine-D-alanine ligase|nr:hypothetical protein [Candidatus Peribacteria bacterium]